MLIPYNLIGILGSDSSLQSSLMMKNDQAFSLTKQEHASIFLSYSFNEPALPIPILSGLNYNLFVHSPLILDRGIGKGRAINCLS